MEGPLLDKSLEFASRVVLFYEEYKKKKKDTTIAKQLLRSTTSIGANINEAVYAPSCPSDRSICIRVLRTGHSFIY